jgi:protein-S-isoprenylcysteine O-methyltransferase Ste14
MMKRLMAFVYGVVCYLAFFATFVYAIGFIGNLYVPNSLDSAAVTPLGRALIINSALLMLFALQHSIMARKWFKDAWTRIVPPPVERSTYVLFSSLALVLMFAFWQPMGIVLWKVSSPVLSGLITGIFGLGWGLVFVATLLINHFDLFGMRQVWLYLQNRPYTNLIFRTPLFYKYVRHPLYLGWLMVFWATPTMTAAHLLFAVATTGYILVAIQFEERDLIRIHGAHYEQYRREVPMILPVGGARVAPTRRADAAYGD